MDDNIYNCEQQVANRDRHKPGKKNKKRKYQTTIEIDNVKNINTHYNNDVVIVNSSVDVINDQNDNKSIRISNHTVFRKAAKINNLNIINDATNDFNSHNSKSKTNNNSVKSTTLSSSSSQSLRWNFTTDYNDHFETPKIAYIDLLPMLQSLAKSIHKEINELIIYDPYYCNGKMITYLHDLGKQYGDDDLIVVLVSCLCVQYSMY